MIPFDCSHCGMKFQVKDEFAGRAGKCPTCQAPLVVPPPTKPVSAPIGQISGTPSSLHQAGLDVSVTLASTGDSLSDGERSAVADLLAGRARTGSRYVIEKEIARGGMGAVVRAVDCDIRRVVAVKFMLTDGDANQKARFVEEAQITGQLEHPNIVPIHELGVDAERRLFFAMKMVNGRSLAQVLDELRKHAAAAEQKWSLNRLLTILTNVCYALAYAHSRGVIHRDLKPANIMLGDFGETYVMDWGLAKVVGHKEPVVPEVSAAPSTSEFTVQTKRGPSASTIGKHAPPSDSSGSNSPKVSTSRELEGELTQDGAVLGTPSYMAPEQARGEVASLDNRSDIYSLGAILYEMLTLQSPVEKEGGAIALLMRVAEGKIVPPEQRAPDRAKAGKIPKELAAIAMKALALKPQNRYQSVEGLRRDVERFQEGRSVSAKRDTPWESAVKFVKRNKAFSAATSVGLVTLTTVLAVAFNVNYAARLRAEEALVLANRNYNAYQSEQQAKNDAIRNSIPGTMRAARQLANDGAVDDALKQIALVRSYVPDSADARLLLGQILSAQRNWPAARQELALYLRQRPEDRDAQALYRFVAKGKTDDLVSLYAAAEVLQRQKLFHLTPLLLQDAAKLLEARKPLATLYDKHTRATFEGRGVELDRNGELRLMLTGMKLTNANGLKGMQLNWLSLNSCTQLTDIDGLRGMPLTQLDLSLCLSLTSLDELRGMPLHTLLFSGCPKIDDLEPLREMPLESLYFRNTAVHDLGPLAGMPLRVLDANGCPIADLSPLRGMALEKLSLASPSIVDLEPLRGMPCRELHLACENLVSFEPLRGMPCARFSLYACGNVESLEPLRGMPCVYMDLYRSGKIKSLEPLRGMPLEWLSLDGCGATDLTPLADLPLVDLRVNVARIERGMEVVRNIKTLKRINLIPGGIVSPAEFWKRYDAGEFKKK